MSPHALAGAESRTAAVPADRRRLLARSALWLALLGPFFFLSYGFANWWTAHHATPGELVFAWERRIPFLPWTIVPYWSIDFCYALSFFLLRDRERLDAHAKRLLAAQLLSVACFLLFPLRFTFERPATHGLFGALFTVLMGFDQPFNQAPSLHIALLVLIWPVYRRLAQGGWCALVDGWAILIGLSVLTTYQHHFIDVPTGALAGLLILWAWPDGSASVLAGWRLSRDHRRLRLGLLYGLGSVLLVVVATAGGGWLWMLWPAVSLALVALFYLGLGGLGFQKQAGRLSSAAAWLLAPYRLGAWINSRAWTREDPESVEIVGGIHLGRVPGAAILRQGGFVGVLDLTPELQVPSGSWRVESLPWLDLVAPGAADLRKAVDAVERLRSRGPVLVCCALGYARSAAAVAAWLLARGCAADVAEAVARLQSCRPRLALVHAHREALEAFLRGSREGGHGA